MSSTPRWARKFFLRFEAVIEERVDEFASSLSTGTMLLDAGAGELHYSDRFKLWIIADQVGSARCLISGEPRRWSALR